jgi:hypothetical protein
VVEPENDEWGAQKRPSSLDIITGIKKRCGTISVVVCMNGFRRLPAR